MADGTSSTPSWTCTTSGSATASWLTTWRSSPSASLSSPSAGCSCALPAEPAVRSRRWATRIVPRQPSGSAWLRWGSRQASRTIPRVLDPDSRLILRSTQTAEPPAHVAVSIGARGRRLRARRWHAKFVGGAPGFFRLRKAAARHIEAKPPGKGPTEAYRNRRAFLSSITSDTPWFERACVVERQLRVCRTFGAQGAWP